MLADLERLIELQEIESKAAMANRTIAEAPGRIAALDTLLRDATATLEGARKSLADNKTRRGTIDKDLAVVQQRQSKYKDQLMEVKTNDEYHAMQHQIAAAAAEVGQLEEKVLINMMEADEINAAIKKAEAASKAAQAKVSSERAAIEQDVDTQRRVVAECAAARGRLIGAMEQKAVVDTFERIAKVRGTAVARAVDERCTVCQVRLRPAVFVVVRRNDQIVQCDSCQRILYFIPPAAARPDEAASSGGASPKP